MKLPKDRNNYESTLIFSPTCTIKELRIAILDYVKQLKRLGAANIGVLFRGRRNFVYPINLAKSGYFIEIYFQSPPQAVPSLQAKYNLDTNVVRGLVLLQES
jgi:ribosomal protein S6